ncbi:pyridoxamine 5'-phosphate oxidase-domain-containing protein [Dipodascopsis uninucleata]
MKFSKVLVLLSAAAVTAHPLSFLSSKATEQSTESSRQRHATSRFDLSPSTILLTAADLIDIDADTVMKRPTVSEAAVQARKLVRHESTGQLATVYQDGDREGIPIALMEYYADCDDDGSLTLLVVEAGPSYKNWQSGSSVSFNIDYHGKGGFTFSPASKPRVSLFGNLTFIDTADTESIEKAQKCFLHRHPDSRPWQPGSKIHKTAYAKFDVESIYWLGGFGNVAYIGDIPVEMYKNVTLPAPHHPKKYLPIPHKPHDGEDGDDKHKKSPKGHIDERQRYGSKLPEIENFFTDCVFEQLKEHMTNWQPGNPGSVVVRPLIDYCDSKAKSQESCSERAGQRHRESLSEESNSRKGDRNDWKHDNMNSKKPFDIIGIYLDDDGRKHVVDSEGLRPHGPPSDRLPFVESHHGPRPHGPPSDRPPFDEPHFGPRPHGPPSDRRPFDEPHHEFSDKASEDVVEDTPNPSVQRQYTFNLEYLRNVIPAILRNL